MYVPLEWQPKGTVNSHGGGAHYEFFGNILHDCTIFFSPASRARPFGYNQRNVLLLDERLAMVLHFGTRCTYPVPFSLLSKHFFFLTS